MVIYSNKKLVILFIIACSLLLQSCDQHHSNGHMMGGGMMGGGMMGQIFPGNGSQLLPDSQSEDAQLFQQYCSQCHALPATIAHTSQEWPQVVARMREHMVTQIKEVPDREQYRKITDYLQRYSG